jgi:hypothetical protein
MKKLLVTLFVALLIAVFGEEVKDYPSVSLLIPYAPCGEKVSKKPEKYLKCGHPTPSMYSSPRPC